MATESQKTLERPQRVRQFSIRHPFLNGGSQNFISELELEFLRPITAGEEGTVAADEPRKVEDILEDLPSFLRNHSLRRVLDNAYESCYRNTMSDWLGDVFGGWFRK